jgi:ribose/xylose/arabinose/galactoside ABC-type transport system permease subunit
MSDDRSEEPSGALPGARSLRSNVFHLATTVVGPFLGLLVVVAFFGIADWLTANPGRGSTFLKPDNFRTVAVQTCVVAVAALGMTLIIISGGIDLSVGSAVALCATMIAWGMREDIAFLARHGSNFRQVSIALNEAQTQLANAERAGNSESLEPLQAAVEERKSELTLVVSDKLEIALAAAESAEDETKRRQWTNAANRLKDKLAAIEAPGFRIRIDNEWYRGVRNAPGSAGLAIAIGLLTGLACGLLNGFLISSLKIVPFIITLGTMTIFSGLGKLIPATPVRPQPWDVPEWIPQMLFPKPQPSWLLVSSGVWVSLVLAVILAAVLRYSVMGRYVFAIGSNEATARLCGINIRRWKMIIYTTAGLFVGVAGLYNFARLSEGDPTSGIGLELRVIAAVVIGGASLSGGRGSVLGTLCGAAIMATITSGCTHLGLPNPVQEVILGIIIIVAVTIDQVRQRRLGAA